MATRSEEQRVARWCMKHISELESEGVDVSALFRVIHTHDPEAFPPPKLRGRKYGRISSDVKDKVGAISNVSPEQFVETICWLIKLVNKPTEGLLFLDKSERYQTYFANTPKGFAKLMLALGAVIPNVDKKAIFRMVSKLFASYNVGTYKTFSYHCNEIGKEDYELLAHYICEMPCDL